ncbi:hypothetical protein, partial [uncultured Mailhella sp.]|uniref:hypothetical protein n=1 Tax=uncultured Mailhella sp. TaxID=1981031 RepID=UPI0025F5DAD8
NFEKFSLLPPRPHPPFKTFHQGKQKTGKQKAAVPQPRGGNAEAATEKARRNAGTQRKKR